jgi:MFS family permease
MPRAAVPAEAGLFSESIMGEEKALTRGQWFALVAAFTGWMFDGVEIGLFPLVARPALQDLLNVTSDKEISSWMSGIVACFLLGAACGGFGFGWLGDKIGRVRTMILSVLTYSIFMGCGYFSREAWQLGLLLFISALGMGGQWSLGVALVMECWPERHRPKLAGAIGAAANFGFLFIALVGLTRSITVSDWRWMMVVGASPALLALFIVAFVPESERWKMAVKQGGRSPIVEIFSHGLLRKTLLATAFSAIPLIGTWAAISAYVPTWAEVMKEAEAGKSLLSKEDLAKFEAAKSPMAKQAVMKACITSQQQWQELGARGSRAKATTQAIMAIGSIICCFLASWFGGLWGRRPVYFCLCLFSLLICFYLFHYLTVVNTWFFFIAMSAGGITAAFYGWLPLYLPELFPTRVRATGQGLSFNFGRVVAAGGTLCQGQFVALFDGDYARAMGIVTLVYVLGMVLIWFAPETKGKPLPD